MSNVTVTDYSNYFRTLAVVDEDLQHNPDAEDGTADAMEKRFTRWTADEAVTGLRNRVGWPALLLEGYEIVSRAQVPYDVKGFYTGAFTILAHATPNDFNSELEAFATAERIYQNILKMIFQDHYGKNKDRCTTPFAEFSFDNLQIIPVGPLFENEFGWRVEFKFKPKYLLQITEPPSYGTIEEVLPPGSYLDADGYITIPAGRLVEKVLLRPAATSSIQAGTAEGSDNLILADEQNANTDRVASFDLVCRTETRIYFSGITSRTKIIVYTRSLSR